MILTIDQLKARFQNRDKPDQADYGDLIDTLVAIAGADPIMPSVVEPQQIIPGTTTGHVLTTAELPGGAKEAQWKALPANDASGGLITGDLIPSLYLYGPQYPAAPATASRLLCNGQMVSKLTYAALYGRIGSTYGPETASHFKLPDFANHWLVGHATGMPMGTAIGASQQQVYVTPANLPAHQHPFAIESGERGFSFSPARASHYNLRVDDGSAIMVIAQNSNVWAVTLDKMPNSSGNLLRNSDGGAVAITPWGSNPTPLTINIAPKSFPAYIYIKT